MASGTYDLEYYTAVRNKMDLHISWQVTLPEKFIEETS